MNDSAAKPRSLRPREHGAYGELGVPLVAALAAHGRTAGAWMLAAAAVLAFLSWEPLLVALGRRGARVKASDGHRAARRFTMLALAAGGCGLGALSLVPTAALWWLLVPLAPGIVMVLSMVAGRVTGRLPEMIGAVALAGAATPVVAFGGAETVDVVTFAVVWCVGFSSLTFAVQATLERPRRGDRAAPIALGSALVVVALAAVALMAWRGWLPGIAPVALAPMTVGAVGVIVARPAPQRLRALGWTAVAASLAAALILVLGG